MSEFSPPNPPLSGPRVTLRQFRLTDAAAIAISCRDQDIPRFTMMLAGLSEEQARQWIESASAGWPEGVARFAITVPPADECVGQVGIQFDLAMRRAEAFYWLDRRARGAGLATEALELVTQWAFRDFGVVRVQLVTDPENVASQRAAERCGFLREGLLRAWQPIKGNQPDVVMYSRVASGA